MNVITQNLLKELFDYCDGVLVNKTKRSKNTILNSSAGSLDKQTGYLKVSINYKSYYVHRLIWLYHYGYMPKIIDHINGIKDDNRIENLREVTQELNTKNSSLRSDNKSGIAGVHWYPSRNKWIAYANVNKKRKTIGYFKSIKEAISARKKVLELNDYHNNHGKIKEEL